MQSTIIQQQNIKHNGNSHLQTITQKQSGNGNARFEKSNKLTPILACTINSPENGIA